MKRAPSQKQKRRELLTATDVRMRETRKAMEADRAFWLLQGGQVAWQAELNRRRAARNERVRRHTAEVLEAKRAAAAADPQPGLWDAA